MFYYFSEPIPHVADYLTHLGYEVHIGDRKMGVATPEELEERALLFWKVNLYNNDIRHFDDSTFQTYGTAQIADPQKILLTLWKRDAGMIKPK